MRNNGEEVPFTLGHVGRIYDEKTGDQQAGYRCDSAGNDMARQAFGGKTEIQRGWPTSSISLPNGRVGNISLGQVGNLAYDTKPKGKRVGPVDLIKGDRTLRHP
jgi:hypothetical protein